MKRETHKQLTYVRFALSRVGENESACNRKTIIMTTNEDI